ncbi:NAD(P)/FAD-dependent oxidoreductase [Acrocarpospora macrocephala]|uniref:Oxidoreductase n=1 Tax=Acrocarpospora macrocephala TaxID=150177 RepID=A0A5M3X3U6_9ACTN|nr:NAD(P)/FAD-dependent oxidoreductase [Acrocarpospora macrocephala]GES15322.1 oxidoreductase [Acrocarpospora macrocephala]
MSDVFDVIVIGAGPAGENVVGRVTRGGLTAAIVEQELAGGECAYWACVPSKALLRPMELVAETGRMPGLKLGPIDVAAVLARRDETVSGYDDSGQIRWIESVNGTPFRGKGRLAGPRQVEVTDGDGGKRLLTARHAVVLATGSTAAIPPVPGLANAQPWTNREATGVKDVPERLVVLGGGVVACEMSQALHALGAKETTLVVRGDRLLGRVEPFASEMVTESLREYGIDVRFNTTIQKVSRPVPGGEVTVDLSDGSRIVADEILVAAGRNLASFDVGLGSIGLAQEGPVAVDDSMRATAVEDGWLYAVGDVNGRNILTHMGKYQARLCGDVIVARATGGKEDLPSMRDRSDIIGAPQVIFTDPNVCAVGRTEERARREGFNVRSVEYDLGAVEGAYLLGDGYKGRAKAVVDEDRRVLLGVTFVGPGAAELLHAATIAVTAEVTLDDLWHAVPTFPTVSEIWLRLLEEYGL